MGPESAQASPKQENNERFINGNSIDEFFADSVVMITGATGFVGKALVEKLLRACPRLAMIFILIRPKRDQTIEQRFKNYLQEPVFDKIRPTNLLNKVRPIKGDVAQHDLGISPEDRKLLIEKVNILFHSAATVRFDEPLKVAVNLNTKGTDRIIQLCKSMKNLVSLIHVSTAYCNPDRKEIKEVIYPTRVKPWTMIDMCESLDSSILDVLENKILEHHPNTYTFTKGLGEQIILDNAKDLPMAIVRPSIIGSADKEPTPGWVDGVFGITAMVLKVGTGNVTSLLCNPKLRVDLIPVDIVVDTLICAAWHSSMQQSNTTKVYNCTTGSNHLSWGTLNDGIVKYSIETPSNYIMWYPCSICRTNRFIHNVSTISLRVLPALVTDIFVRLTGGTPKLMKRMESVKRIARSTEFFRVNEWTFHNDNVIDMAKKLKSLKDGNNFTVTTEGLNWESYIRNYVLGVRKYVLKDTPDSLKEARSRLHIFHWLHRLTKVFSVLAVLMIIMRISH
nr:PREDICTED: putative fatty acyl-CoA reductase CG5065 [Megachile rotundata]XP_012134573.1 PREDICTED: putative fatty acyl-CoA reductase CG5065 [Megachile rotundata]XP_012134574.1 PREDICTED: putative fatty acyl-CoA reductase CG5065 [Megachile rotundata]